MKFQKYIKAIGTGPKSNRDLSYEESFEATQMILEEQCESEQAAAFLMLLRVKLESDDELKGCFDAFDKYIKRTAINESVEIGFSYDGKNKQPFLFPLYGKVLKAFFEKYPEYKAFDIVISGDEWQPANPGVTVKQLVNAISLEDNIHFFDRAVFFKELSALSSLRKKLFMRTVFNTVEKLLNPASSKYAITSAFHKPYVKKYHHLFAKNYENLMIIKGNEGTPEVFADFKYWQVINGETQEYNLKLEAFNISYNTEYENITLEQMVEVITHPSEEIMQLVRLNVAVLLVVTQRINSVQEAYELLESIG